MDLNMPVMNGWEFLDLFNKTISNEFSQTKVIILSSTIDPADYNKAKQYDVVSHFLSKPITVEMLENLKPIYS
ncbi:response regulator [Flavobacterium piscinae]|uniref:response regulator n=1 Tax=Flavobacterium piscinae TaxID=2506424 RepID=UPI002AAB9960|nr:response regulator [Flavobacterium piscinae]